MEEKQTLPSPIAGEPASLKHIGYALEMAEKLILEATHKKTLNTPIWCYKEELIKTQHHLINAKYSVPQPVALNPGMVVPRGALMALRSTLHRALWDFADTADGWAAAADDLAAAVGNAHEQVTALLGITEPAPSIADELEAADLEGWN